MPKLENMRESVDPKLLIKLRDCVIRGKSEGLELVGSNGPYLATARCRIWDMGDCPSQSQEFPLCNNCEHAQRTLATLIALVSNSRIFRKGEVTCDIVPLDAPGRFDTTSIMAHIYFPLEKAYGYRSIDFYQGASYGDILDEGGDSIRINKGFALFVLNRGSDVIRRPDVWKAIQKVIMNDRVVISSSDHRISHDADDVTRAATHNEKSIQQLRNRQEDIRGIFHKKNPVTKLPDKDSLPDFLYRRKR
jgi:hypothetical protein